MGVTESKLTVSETSYVNKGPNLDRFPDARTIPQRLEHHARTIPGREAIVFASPSGGRVAVTFSELYENSLLVAKNILGLGVKSGETLAVSLRTCPEWLFVTFGAIMAGVRPFPVSFTYTDGSDIVEVLKKLENCSCIIMDRGFQGNNWTILSDLLDSYSAAGDVKSATLPSLRYLMCYKNSMKGAKSFDDMLVDGESCHELPVVEEEDVAIYLQTSGSTGVPKIITHTHQSLLSFMDFELGPAYSDSDILFHDLQFNWIGGFPANVFIGQTRVTSLGTCPPSSDRPAYLRDVIRRERCTIFAGLPSLVHEMFEGKEKMDDDWSIKTVVTGGLPITKQFLMDLGKICKYTIVAYNISEALMISANVLLDPHLFEEYNNGQIVKGREIKVVGPDGTTVPVGKLGDIYVRGNNVFKGYFNDPGRSKVALTDDGWYKTDDAGRILQDGSLIVEGRLSNVIIVGGINVIPEILECLLDNCPDVEKAILVPVPDYVLYQVICACVIPRPGCDVTEAELRRFCEEMHGDRERIFTVLPKYFLILESFPETRTGKVSRKALESLAKDKYSKFSLTEYTCNTLR